MDWYSPWGHKESDMTEGLSSLMDTTSSSDKSVYCEMSAPALRVYKEAGGRKPVTYNLIKVIQDHPGSQ